MLTRGGAGCVALSDCWLRGRRLPVHWLSRTGVPRACNMPHMLGLRYRQGRRRETYRCQGAEEGAEDDRLESRASVQLR